MIEISKELFDRIRYLVNEDALSWEARADALKKIFGDGEKMLSMGDLSQLPNVGDESRKVLNNDLYAVSREANGHWSDADSIIFQTLYLNLKQDMNGSNVCAFLDPIMGRTEHALSTRASKKENNLNNWDVFVDGELKVKPFVSHGYQLYPHPRKDLPEGMPDVGIKKELHGFLGHILYDAIHNGRKMQYMGNSAILGLRKSWALFAVNIVNNSDAIAKAYGVKGKFVIEEKPSGPNKKTQIIAFVKDGGS